MLYLWIYAELINYSHQHTTYRWTCTSLFVISIRTDHRHVGKNDFCCPWLWTFFSVVVFIVLTFIFIHFMSSQHSSFRFSISRPLPCLSIFIYSSPFFFFHTCPDFFFFFFYIFLTAKTWHINLFMTDASVHHCVHPGASAALFSLNFFPTKMHF